MALKTNSDARDGFATQVAKKRTSAAEAVKRRLFYGTVENILSG
jgi:hypothetical protein